MAKQPVQAPQNPTAGLFTGFQDNYEFQKPEVTGDTVGTSFFPGSTDYGQIPSDVTAGMQPEAIDIGREIGVYDEVPWLDVVFGEGSSADSFRDIFKELVSVIQKTPGEDRKPFIVTLNQWNVLVGKYLDGEASYEDLENFDPGVLAGTSQWNDVYTSVMDAIAEGPADTGEQDQKDAEKADKDAEQADKDAVEKTDKDAAEKADKDATEKADKDAEDAEKDKDAEQDDKDAEDSEKDAEENSRPT